MSRKRESESIFSGPKGEVQEEMSIAVLEKDDIHPSAFPDGLIAAKLRDEPQQDSLIKKDRDAKFDIGKFHPKVKEKYKRDMMFVRGQFRNHECPGGELKFYAKAYGDLEEHLMFDGGRYTVRKCVADHINNNCKVTAYSDQPVETGTMGHTGGSRSFQYVPLINGGRQRFNFIIEEIVAES